MAFPQHGFSSSSSPASTSFFSPSLSTVGTDVDQASVKRQRSMKTREFGHYAAHGSEHQSEAGPDMKLRSDAPSNAALHDNPNYNLQQRQQQHNDSTDYYDTFDEMPHVAISTPISPSVPQLPPLPISPISPRWDSLFQGSSAAKFDPALSLGGGSTSMEKSSPRPPVGLRSQTAPFPGLSSHPFAGDQHPPGASSPIRNFSLRESPSRGAHYRPLTPSSSTTKSFQTDTSPAGDGVPAVENFSRPRKPSIKQGGSELAVPRQRTGTLPESSDLNFSDQYPSNASLNPTIQHNGWYRGRGYSASSARSTNTYASLPHRPSNDQLHGTSRTASFRRATPSSNMTRPPITYSETSTTPSNARDFPPWVSAGDDEVRSSFRSQLTASTALGTVFTVNGTERSSVLTKTSSITESLIINGYARASVVEDDGLSVEDVMGMYENGFHDDSDQEDEGDDAKEGPDESQNGMRELGPGGASSASRPPTGDSGTGRLVEQMLEAMSEPLPIPGSSAVPSAGPLFARDSAAMFRVSGLPSSLPQDIGLGLASERVETRTASKAGDSDNMGDTFAPQQGPASTLGKDEMITTSAGQASDEPSTQPHQTESSAPFPPNATPASFQPPTPAPGPLPQEPEEDPSSRDRYGFRKANQYVTREQYDAWNASYTDYLARRRKKWVAYLKDNSLMTDNPNRFPPRNAKTKRFVRKGIPPDWRGAAWFYYAGGPRLLAKHPGVYDDMVRRAGLQSTGAGKAIPGRCDLKPVIVEDIEKDLHRTFPDNVRFKPPRRTIPRRPHHPASPVGTEDSQRTLTNQDDEAPETAAEEEEESEIISSLRRVLHAFALYNPRIGYCQSLNFLAGLLLLFVESEEHAFWLLNVITRVYLPGTHDMSLEGSKVDLGVLMAALKEALPSVWKQIGGDDSEMATAGLKKTKSKRFRDVSTPAAGKITPADPNHLPTITLCMTAWFMSCFIGTLPVETVLRVWDIFFYEGSRTLFRIALTIFKAGEAEIKAVADPMEMFGVVQALPRRMLDCNRLLEACYKKRNNFKHLNQELVEERRQEHREAIRRWKEAQEAAAAGGNAAGAATSNNGLVGGGGGGRGAAGLDLAADMTDLDGIEVRRKGTLFGRRKDKEKARAEDVL